MNIGNYITIIAYLVTIGISWGVVTTKITQLQHEILLMKEENQKASESLEKFQTLSIESFEKITNRRFDELEKKQDKHNNLIERMTIVEQSTKSAHKRIDSLCEDVQIPHRKELV